MEPNLADPGFEAIRPQVRQEIADYIRDYAVRNQYGLSAIPAHEHTGTDVAQVSYGNLSDRTFFVTTKVPGTSAATAANYGVFFVAPYRCVVLSVREVHGTAGTDGGAVTLNVEKLLPGVALNSGSELLPTPFSLKTTAAYSQAGTLTPTLSTRQLAVGDRLALRDAGTLTAVADVCVIMEITY